jgi:hypothetical protein
MLYSAPLLLANPLAFSGHLPVTEFRVHGRAFFVQPAHYA